MASPLSCSASWWQSCARRCESRSAMASNLKPALQKLPPELPPDPQLSAMSTPCTDARRGSPGANSKGRKVPGWYPEAGLVILGSLSNLLQMNLPDSAEYKAQREYRQNSYQFKHQRHHRCVPSGAASVLRKS